MVRYFGPDNGSAYVILPTGRPAVGRVAEVFSDEGGTVLADILDGDRNTQGAPVDQIVVDSTGRLNFWFPDEQPVCWVSVNNGPLVRVTADLQDQLDDAIVGGGGGGGVTEGYVSAAIATHSDDTTSVHGIPDTSLLETQAGAQTKATTAQNAAISAAATDATTKANTAQASAVSTAAGDATTKANAAQAAAIAAAATDATTKANSAQSAAIATAGTNADSKVAAHAAAADPHGDRAYADAGLATKADLVGGLVPTSQIPALAITDVFTVASQAAMLALTAERGDLAIRTDNGHRYILQTAPPSTLGNWVDLGAATDAVSSVNGQTGVVVLAKGDVGLGNVDNTTDAGKPVSTAQQTALDLKANLASPTFTGTVGGITAAMVGLGSVDNTADTAKPVSTAQQTALNLKANLASPAFTGTPSLPTGATAVTQTAGNSTTALATTAFVTTADNLKAPLAAPTFTGVPAAPTAAQGTNTTQIATTAYVQTEAGLLVPKTLYTGKGTILAGSAANTPGTLAAGTNGDVLTLDSAQTLGVKWATPSGGGGGGGLPLALNPKGGRWNVVPIGRAGTNYTPVINRLCLVPLPIGPSARTLTGISFEIATAAGAGGLGRCMLLNSLSTWEPNLAVADYGTKVTTATGALTWVVSEALSANTLYWVGFNPTVAAPVMRGVDGYNPYVGLNAAVTGTTSFGMFVMNSVSGALGATPFTYFDVDLALRVSVQFS